MSSSKKTRFLALTSAFIFALQLFAQEVKVGDYVELDQYLHGRDDGKFRKEDDNVKATLPPGTHGKITQTKHFSKTQYSPSERGNWGVEIELTAPVNGRTKFWIYYTPDKPNMKFSATDTFAKPGDVSADKVAAGTDKVETAKSAVVTQKAAGTSVAAASAGADQALEQAKAAAQSAILALDHANGQNKSGGADCVSCAVQVTGNDSNEDIKPLCPKVPDQTVGNYTVSHIENGKACDVVVKPVDSMKTKLRSYSVSSDGQFGISFQGNKQGFYLLPRGHESGGDVVDADGKVEIRLKTAGGQTILIDPTSGKITNMDGVQGSGPLPPEPGQPQTSVKADKDALYFIKPKAGQSVIDLGTHYDSKPETQRDKTAIYHSDKADCDITMDNLFNYDVEKNSQNVVGVNFKFREDSALQNVLNSKCKTEK